MTIKGILPPDSWLRKNGYSGLVQAKRKHPELFAHIPQAAAKTKPKPKT